MFRQYKFSEITRQKEVVVRENTFFIQKISKTKLDFSFISFQLYRNSTINRQSFIDVDFIVLITCSREENWQDVIFDEKKLQREGWNILFNPLPLQNNVLKLLCGEILYNFTHCHALKLRYKSIKKIWRVRLPLFNYLYCNFNF